ncbi:hypothetical protein HK102_010597, partial [Quaeritorhiza haematococci]
DSVWKSPVMQKLGGVVVGIGVVEQHTSDPLVINILLGFQVIYGIISLGLIGGLPDEYGHGREWYGFLAYISNILICGLILTSRMSGDVRISNWIEKTFKREKGSGAWWVGVGSLVLVMILGTALTGLVMVYENEIYTCVIRSDQIPIAPSLPPLYKYGKTLSPILEGQFQYTDMTNITDITPSNMCIASSDSLPIATLRKAAGLTIFYVVVQ